MSSGRTSATALSRRYEKPIAAAAFPPYRLSARLLTPVVAICLALYVFASLYERGVQGRPSGVLIVTDTTPDEPVEYVKVNKPSMNSSAGVYHCFTCMHAAPHYRSHALGWLTRETSVCARRD